MEQFLIYYVRKEPIFEDNPVECISIRADSIDEAVKQMPKAASYSIERLEADGERYEI